MKITKYEIDMLDVKSADAFLIHFYDDDDNDKDYIILVDAGNYNDGPTIANFIKNRYGKKNIDLAICSHCDKDHFGGFVWLLEQIRDNAPNRINISHFWVDDPADHVSLGTVNRIRAHDSLVVKARSVYDLGDNKNMLDILDELCNIKLTWTEPFSDAGEYSDKPYSVYEFDNHIEVLGPSVTYYEQLVPDFRNELKKKDYTTDENEDATITLIEGRVYSKTLDDAGDDPSSHNQSSVIFIFKPDDGKKFLFMGDAGRDAIDHFSYEEDKDKIKGIYWLKVPHHGSKYNMDNCMIDHLRPKNAFISTEKVGHYLSQAVVNALKKCNCKVCSTHKHGSVCHHCGTASRDDYSSIISFL